MQINEVVATFDFGPIPLEDLSLTFRVDIYRTIGKRRQFFARVWRFEMFRIQPTFPQEEGKPSHHPSDETIILEEFIFHVGRDQSRESAFAVLQDVLAQIGEKFLTSEETALALETIKEELGHVT